MPETPIVDTTMGLLRLLIEGRKKLGNWVADQVKAAAIAHNENDPRPIRPAQLAQAFGQEQMFPKQSLRPTSLTKFQDQPTYSMEPYFPKKIDMGDLAGTRMPATLPYKLTDEERQSILGDQEPPQFSFDPNPTLALEKQLGLGHGTLSLGKDPQGKPYLSVFDSWDFRPGGPGGGDTSEVDEISRAILNRHTKPFNLYDRVPFELQGDRIPAFVYPTVDRSRDINLPKSQADADELTRQAQIRMLTKPPARK